MQEYKRNKKIKLGLNYKNNPRNGVGSLSAQLVRECTNSEPGLSNNPPFNRLKLGNTFSGSRVKRIFLLCKDSNANYFLYYCRVSG